MKVKAVDIARKLNISKATVSLALNHRPGVSQQTKDAVFQCLAELEEKAAEPHAKQMIKVIVVRGELWKNEEMDLWTDFYEAMDKSIRKMGYTLNLTFVKMGSSDLEQAIEDANDENIAGVMVSATEFQPDDFAVLERIKKPVVIYDNDAGDKYHCLVIGNMAAVRDAVDLLVSRGCRNIKYLGNSVDIYNFRERKAGFRAGLRKNRLELKKDSIMQVGKNINEIYEYMLSYLQTNKLPDAFIMDNYQVSVGVMKALKALNISVPQDVSLIGVDELPSFVMADYNLMTIKVDHSERIQALMLFLEQEIQGNLSSKFKIFSNCELMQGNSVK